MTPFSGGCLCGAVRYEVGAAPQAVYLCHCRACQYTSGGEPSTVVAVPRAAFHCTGELRQHRTVADSGFVSTRSFCPVCGTHVFGEPGAVPDIVMLKAGSMDDAGALRPQAAIWVARAQPWAHMPEGLPRFDGNPEG